MVLYLISKNIYKVPSLLHEAIEPSLTAPKRFQALEESESCLKSFNHGSFSTNHPFFPWFEGHGPRQQGNGWVFKWVYLVQSRSTSGHEKKDKQEPQDQKEQWVEQKVQCFDKEKGPHERFKKVHGWGGKKGDNPTEASSKCQVHGYGWAFHGGSWLRSLLRNAGEGYADYGQGTIKFKCMRPCTFPWLQICYNFFVLCKLYDLTFLNNWDFHIALY